MSVACGNPDRPCSRLSLVRRAMQGRLRRCTFCGPRAIVEALKTFRQAVPRHPQRRMGQPAIEPIVMRGACRKPRWTGWETRQVGLGSEDGESDIHLAGVFSSVLPRNQAVALPPFWPEQTGGVERIKVIRLDGVSREILNPNHRTWLKIDVQGFELKVLEGAAVTLPQIAAIEVEVFPVPDLCGSTGHARSTEFPEVVRIRRDLPESVLRGRASRSNAPGRCYFGAQERFLIRHEFKTRCLRGARAAPAARRQDRHC